MLHNYACMPCMHVSIEARIGARAALLLKLIPVIILHRQRLAHVFTMKLTWVVRRWARDEKADAKARFFRG